MTDHRIRVNRNMMRSETLQEQLLRSNQGDRMLQLKNAAD